ncbi:MAG: GSCFA domain-containing protein [Pikeienuella sp.]
MSNLSKTPYSEAPPESFWASCADDPTFYLSQLWVPKFDITSSTAIATAGSCFAQHIGARLRQSDANFLDVEPRLEVLGEAAGKKFGYDLFSARYGNIYTARQLLHLVQDCRKSRVRKHAFWTKGRAWYDALRPTMEPEGLTSLEEAKAHRIHHLGKVKSLFQQTDVLIFTLGLTEYWRDRRTGTAYPTCPGLVAGEFDPKLHELRIAPYEEVMADMKSALSALRRLNSKMNVILTISPIPLTATASGGHVVPATIYSKSVLRAVAGQLTETFDHVDYFPSFELVTSAAFGHHYTGDGRQVSNAGIDLAMNAFFANCSLNASTSQIADTKTEINDQEDGPDDLHCDELLMGAFR